MCQSPHKELQSCYILEFSHPLLGVYISILLVRKLRHRMSKQLVESCQPSKWKLRFSVCFLTSIYRPLKLQDLYCFKEDRTLIGCLKVLHAPPACSKRVPVLIKIHFAKTQKKFIFLLSNAISSLMQLVTLT